MEKEQRTRLQKATQDARKLLEEEFRSQLLQTYDIDVDKVRWAEEPGAHLLAEQRLIREKLIAWIEHKEAQINDRKEALLLALREMAFTALNRFVALKLMEARELVRPCVSGGLESAGFLEFTAVAEGLLADQESSYRLYLETIFEDVSRELRALFDPRDPASLLWPKRTALLELLEILNRPELAELWIEDETLGWVYQYFNGDAERKKMREESSAPRNSRELAVRNQFFTPRYVVEFLTDNTLGRIWYEMRQGRSGLKEHCRYLVRRPNEIWLQPGEEAPAHPDTEESLSQEELLRQPVHIPHRELKDPREIRMLDPACGSMHFGLYAFDLYLTIYAEAWEIAQCSDEQVEPGEAFAPFAAYAAAFADRATFLREIPSLILRHNIHGIDIDVRATQIARLTLWLRAQRAWKEQRLEVADRPAITRSNVVCAEPMPGERELLVDFVDQEFPEAGGLVQQLLEAIFDKMQLAGEAGSLLNIEEEIRDAIEQARKEWQKLEVQQQELFTATEFAALGQAGSSLNADLQNLTKDFWINIEERIYAALRDYASQAASGGYQRRLFAEDAAQGFAFIDVCRLRYDAVVMNPPFGEPSKQSSTLQNSKYSETSADIDAAFVDRAAEVMLDNGLLGGIYNRTQFFKGYLCDWRDRNLLIKRQLSTCLDLGLGVLDGAMVEAAAYTTSVSSQRRPAVFISALAHIDKKHAIDSEYKAIMGGRAEGESRIILPSSLLRLPSHRISYWVAPPLLEAFETHESLEGNYGYARQGLITADNDRFLRLIWEAPATQIGRGDLCCIEADKNPRARDQAWIPYAKGGDYSPFFGDIHLVVNWGAEGREICHFFRDGRLASRPQNIGFYFKRALTYTERTASDISPRVMPDECIFDCKGPIIAASRDDRHLLGLLSLVNSKVFKYFVELSLAGGDSSVSVGAARQFTQSIVGSVPVPRDFEEMNHELAYFASTIWQEMASDNAMEETSRFYCGDICKSAAMDRNLRESFNALSISQDSRFLRLLDLTENLEQRVFELYGIDDDTRREIVDIIGEHPNRLIDQSFLKLPQDEQKRILAMPVDDIIAELRLAGSAARWITKMCYSADRWLEVVASAYSTKPSLIVEKKKELGEISKAYYSSKCSDLLSYSIGVAFGRWDIRYAKGERVTPELPDPFAPLPTCPPGQLQNAQGLPARPEDVPAAYPVLIPWDGILVDDPNHPLDLERRVTEVIEIIWSGQEGGSTAESIEHEACDILGIKTLRDYFRKPAGFFANHLSRYSKSRRQAPIYWQLSAGSGSYSAWLYYHRFTQDTLYRLLRDFVEPRIQQAEREQFELESQGALSGDAAVRLQEAQTLLQDLRILKSELDLVAPLWNPNLNDGVIINHAILWRITPYTPWQKKCKGCWDKLMKGDYDWAHLAFHLWPERVISKCTTDRSLAIAHGLEERLWQETNNGNWLPRQLSEAGLQALIAEHSNPAVKSALERFLAAPPPVAPTRTRASRSTRSTGSSAPRRPRGTAAVVDAEATRQVLLALTAAPSDGLAKAAIADLIGVEANALTAVIKQLKESGQIDQLGERRGARYVLSEQGQAAVASETEVDA